MSVLDSFHYQLSGPETAPKLVFLHGLMGSAANWRKITQAFEQERQILTYDQRGHGRSFKPLSGYAPEDYAEDLLQILAELGWEKIQLVGHSMGGRNALSFANKYPEKVSHLVIEDIGPEASREAVERIKKLIALVPTPFANKQKAKEFLLHDFVQKISYNAHAKTLAQYFYTNIEEKPDGTADWRFYKPGILESMHLGRQEDRWDLVKNLKMPTLWLRGANTEELPKEIYGRILLENPLIKGIEIPQAGHWVHFDQPEAFVKALKEFLKIGPQA